MLDLDWCWVVAWIGDLNYDCHANAISPDLLLHNTHGMRWVCHFVLHDSLPRGVVRGLPRSFAVLRLCLWHHNPHAIVDSLIEEMDSFHREGEIGKKKMMFLNHRRLHQLEIGDGFFRYTSRGGHSKLRYVKI